MTYSHSYSIKTVMKFPILSYKVAKAAAISILFAGAVAHAQDESSADEGVAILKDFGLLMGQQINSQIEMLDLSQAEREAFLDGFQAALDGVKGPINDRQAQMKIQQYLQQRMAAAQAKKSADFFAELESNPNVKKSDTGLYYEIIEAGDDSRAGETDTVKLNYEGALPDGTVFDSSFERGNPATFPVSGVVPGFGEGVQLVGPGGKVKLYIPANLGYGERPPPGSGIPPNSPLVFDVEMIEINPEG